MPAGLIGGLALGVVLALACPAPAQQGVRAKSPRPDAGAQALADLRQAIATQRATNAAAPASPAALPAVGPIASACRLHHTCTPACTPRGWAYDARLGSAGLTISGQIAGRFGDVFGRVRLSSEPIAALVPVGAVVASAPWPCTVQRLPACGRCTLPIGLGSAGCRCDAPRTDRRDVVQGPVVIVIDRTGVTSNQPTAPSEQAPPQPRPDPRARGIADLRLGNVSQAIDALTEHLLADPKDHHAERLLGLALLLDGRDELGIALLSRAYQAQPELAARPLTRRDVHALSAWRSAQRKAQRWAQHRRTASAWLAAIVLTQDELPADTNLLRLEQARLAGLAPALADALQAALRSARDGSAQADTPALDAEDGFSERPANP